MIEAVLFDNDGVLVDTEGLYFEAGRSTLAEIGIEMTLEQYQKIWLREGRSGLPSEFELVLVREDNPRAKPFPDPYATAVQRLGVDPSSCVAIEDTQRGIDAATAAGVRCFACASPMTRGTSFKGAVGLLNSVRELPAAVRRLDTQ